LKAGGTTLKKPLNVLFATWEGGGNVTPMLETVRKLIAAGHRVRVLSEECNRSEAIAFGAEFSSWTRALSRKDRSRATQTANDWEAPTPQEGLMRIISAVWCGPALAYAQDVIEELNREPADLVVVAEVLVGVMAGCESIGQKFVTFSPNISLAPLPGVPPMGPGVPPARNDEERAMHVHMAEAVQNLLDTGLPALNNARIALGLKPLQHVLDQLKAANVELLATSKAFDFPCDSLPERVRYVGPQLNDPQWSKSWKSPWAPADKRPLVTVSFSTTFQNHGAVLQRVIDALAPLPVRVLVTLGGSIEVNELRPGDNCKIVEAAPHSVVMPESAFVVNHGGHGSVMRGLISRVPMLIVPHGRDQNDNAIRVTERGAGLSLMPDASVETIRSACMRLLNEPEFRAAAQRLGTRIAEEAEHSTIVQELESAALHADETSGVTLASRC
jgi:MGT family glycosyltransferase